MLWCAIEYYCFYLLLYKKKGIKMHFSIFYLTLKEKKMPQNNKNDSLVT